MYYFKTKLPYTRMNYSAMSKAHALRTHVMGCVVFSDSITCHIDCLEYPHDTNLNVNVILQVENFIFIMHFRMRSAYYFQALLNRRGNMPKKLHIQLDNTMRENKNQHMMNFCAFLVEKEILEEVAYNCTFSSAMIKYFYIPG